MKLEIHIHVHQSGDDRNTARILEAINDMQQEIKRLMATITETLEQTLARVTETKGKVESLAVLTGSIKARLDEALTGVLTPEQQAKVDAIFAEVDAAGQAATDAINANDDDPNT